FADEGNAVVLITHKLREALAIADDLTVLRRGRVALSGTAVGMTIDDVSTALLGDRNEPEKKRALETVVGDIVAELRGVTVLDDRAATALRDATLQVRAGEIVGIAAVEGAGQHELLRLLSGRRIATTGVVRLPRTVGFIPEDRHRDALLLDFSLTENVVIR